MTALAPAPNDVLRTYLIAALLLALPACGGAKSSPPWSPPPLDPGASLVRIPGAAFVMGDAKGDANEAPHPVVVGEFQIMRYEVTNKQFARFVAATAYVTDAERRGLGHVWPGTWKRVKGADWRHPYGPASTIDGLDHHPVVQVSWRDAAAFCAHYRLRLPTEEEWELAARGTDGRRYPWGDEAPKSRAHQPRRVNSGTVKCCAADATDGFAKTAPVGYFPAGASPQRLQDMAGNVWEWTASPFPDRPGMVALRGGGWGNNNYCLRTSYRHANPPNRGLDMVGFRCAR